MKILIADGLSESGITLLKEANFEIFKTTVAQNQLENFINTNTIDILIVRGITKVTKELIDACPTLKLIGRAGVGMDNIAVTYAINKGIKIINTPLASGNSVAELVFAHLFGMVRFLHQSNREMPLEGDSRFNDLKKQFSQGTELRGKTIGIIGFGNIGQEVAKIALGLGMRVIANSTSIKTVKLTLPFYNGASVDFDIETQTLETVLKEADFISLHVPKQDNYLIDQKQIDQMKKCVGIVNTARGGVIDEVALINAIESEHIKYAALDVFENEPKPEIQILMNPEISFTPHIGGSTLESQERISIELAQKIISLLK
jgi:D-3-phosphoglycerate dehydrogenase